MLDVSTKAKGKLEDILQKKTEDDSAAIRIVVSNENPNQLRMQLDTEKPGDQIVEGSSGTKVLLVDSALSASLEGKVLDYIETEQREGFSLIHCNAEKN